MKKAINVDYDGTFTSDPYLWTLLIKAAQLRGHQIFCITQRIGRQSSVEELTKAFPSGVMIFFTNHNPKKQWADRRGIKIDIWIEDNPLAIFQSDNPEKQICDELTPMLTESCQQHQLINQQ